MTDEQMDARLRAAGERWRAEHTEVATVEPAAVTEHELADIAAPSARRRRTGLIASAAAVAAALVVGGTFLLRDVGNGGSGPSGDTAALEGHVWLLQGVQGTSSTATLYVDHDGNLVADDECQLIGGKVAVDGNTMTVTDQVRRYKSCTDQYGPGYYEAGAAALNGASSFEITSDDLTIHHGDTALRFILAPDGTPAPTMDFPTLVGTDWKLVSAKDADGNQVNVAGDPTLRIDDSGNLTGTDGCNTLPGSVTMNGDRITVGQVGGTEKYCPGDAGATEAAILAFMQGPATEVVTGGTLTMTKGQAELVYRWQPQDTAATDPALLLGTQWLLVSAAGETVTPDQVLKIGTDGTVSGNSGCGALAGSADVGPGLVTFTGISESAASCKLASASTLTSFLQGQQIWSVRNGMLVLSGSSAQAFAMIFDQYSPTQPPSNAELVGPTWHLIGIKSGDGRYRNGAPPAEESTLTFTETGFMVLHTCYTERGDATIDHATIATTDVHTTDAHPCPFQPGRDEAANLVDSVLTGTLDWSIDADSLTLHNGDSTLTYAVDATSKNAPLTGTDWQLETAVDQNGTDHPANGLRLGLTGGKLLAEDGVNTISGSVHIGDGTITLADVASSAVGSTQDDPVRTAVDDVLQDGDIGYQVNGDGLTLTRGPEQLIYRAHQASSSDSIVGSWNLTTIEHGTGADGTASTVSPVTVLIFGDGAAKFSCGVQTTVDVAATTLDFAQWKVAPDLCPQGIADEDFLLHNMFAGTCSYTIDGDQLTITKEGVGATMLTRA